jgi:hypothetical protein
VVLYEANGLQGYTTNRIRKYNLAFLVSREMTLLSAMLVRLLTISVMFSFQHQILTLLQPSSQPTCRHIPQDNAPQEKWNKRSS